MRYLIMGTLYLLASMLIVLLVLFGIDSTVAYRDYETLKSNGDYEQRVTGCIFDFVCERYTKDLWK